MQDYILLRALFSVHARFTNTEGRKKYNFPASLSKVITIHATKMSYRSDYKEETLPESRVTLRPSLVPKTTMELPRKRADSVLTPLATPHEELKKQKDSRPTKRFLSPSYYREKKSGKVQKTSSKLKFEAAQAKLQSEREQAAHQRELAKRRARWLGCGCEDCAPFAQRSTHWPSKISSGKDLRYHGHDPFAIVEWAVSSFNRPDLLPVQKTALSQWSALAKTLNLKRGLLSQESVIEATKIFNKLFFRDQLPLSRLHVVLESEPSPNLGATRSSTTCLQPEGITIYMAGQCLWARPTKVLQIVLHEMAHAFISRYACNPSRGIRISGSACGTSCYINRGPGGHGRAWQYLVKAIEENMPQYLNLPGRLGRDDGMGTDIRLGRCMPCAKEIERLYQFESKNYGRIYWRVMRRTRDDNCTELHDDYFGRMMAKQRPRVARRASMVARQPGCPEVWL